MTTLIVIAKECVPGKVKTRLCPPLTLVEAAQVAAASLGATLDAVRGLPASRRILFFDGQVAPRESMGYELIAQPSGSLDERLAAVFDLVSGPAVLIGMDTPQLTGDDLAAAFDWSGEVDAWFGPANDGGFWALGLREPTGDLLRGVPMSQDDTGARQCTRLRDAGLRIGLLRELTDVDTIDDAREVAALHPDSTFATTLNRFDRILV